MSLIRVLAYGSAISTYILIIVGGYVSATGSGLACPDWPLCQGQVVPPLVGAVLIEYTHRLSALIVSVLVLSTMIYSVARLQQYREVLTLSIGGFVLLLVQVIFGMLTVTSELNPVLSTAHLGLGTGVFAIVLANALEVRRMTTRLQANQALARGSR